MFSALIKKINNKLINDIGMKLVYTFEKADFDGDPTVIVIPSDNESDYNTTEENIRIYAFTLRVFVKRTTPRTPDTCEEVMRDIVTDIIDAFDQDYTLDGISQDIPAGYTYINTFAVPSSWGYSTIREDEYRVAEITLRCRVSVDLSAI